MRIEGLDDETEVMLAHSTMHAMQTHARSLAGLP